MVWKTHRGEFPSNRVVAAMESLTRQIDIRLVGARGLADAVVEVIIGDDPSDPGHAKLIAVLREHYKSRPRNPWHIGVATVDGDRLTMQFSRLH